MFVYVEFIVHLVFMSFFFTKILFRKMHFLLFDIYHAKKGGLIFDFHLLPILMQLHLQMIIFMAY